MKCSKCGREITPETAYRCADCGRDYCEVCALTSGMCECRGQFGMYS